MHAGCTLHDGYNVTDNKQHSIMNLIRGCKKQPRGARSLSRLQQAAATDLLKQHITSSHSLDMRSSLHSERMPGIDRRIYWEGGVLGSLLIVHTWYTHSAPKQ